MKIHKIINNNIVSSIDEKGKEILMMGRGIGYRGTKGAKINIDEVEKTFRLESAVVPGNSIEFTVEFPMVHTKIADEIIAYAEELLNISLSQNIFFILTDHIGLVMRRHENLAPFVYPLKWDVRQCYPKEYLIGEYAIELIGEKTGLALGDDVAAMITMHFVNAVTYVDFLAAEKKL